MRSRSVKLSRRIAIIAAREVQRFVAAASERVAQAERAHGHKRPSFRPLTEAETEAMLGGELLASLSGVRRHA